MKKILCLVLMGVFALSGAHQALALGDEIVFINLDKVFEGFYKTKLADTQLKELAEEFQKERKDLLDKFQAKQAEFKASREKAQDTALSEKVRNEQRNQAEELLVDLKGQEQRITNFDKSRSKQLDDQGRRMRKRIVNEISEAVGTYARNQNYRAVIDSSGNSQNMVELVLYADVKADITAEVVDILNKGFKGEVE